MTTPIRWQLELNGDVIAQIIDEHNCDFPWIYGRLVNDIKLKRFSDYFNHSAEDWNDDIEAIYEEVNLHCGFILRDLQTGTVHQYLTLYDYDNLFVCFRY